ncbi:MAG: aminotransferase class V-fold PLP-dependent enzyme [Planctomycetota bacterium]
MTAITSQSATPRPWAIEGSPVLSAVDRLDTTLAGSPLTESAVVEHLHPLFSRVLERDEIYLANHSLGRPLDQLADDMRELTDLWYTDMDGAWGAWMDEHTRYRRMMAALIGCARWDCIVPKTSAAQGLRTVLNALPAGDEPPRRLRVIAPEAEFDSIDFVLKAYARKGRIELTRVPAGDDGITGVEDIERAITGAAEPPDLVVLSQVLFATGQQVEGVEGVVASAHARGSLVLLDTYHATGVLPWSFDNVGADFAIGGNYKYTRGGPGACWLAVHPRHLDREDLFSVDTGWFAKRDTFGYRRSETAEFAEGGDGWLEATPPIATLYQARSGLMLTLAIGVERMRAFQLDLQRHLIGTLREHDVPLHLIEQRGAFFLMPVEDLPETLAALKDAGVNADGRPARFGTESRAFVRFCPDLLNTRTELERAATRIAKVMKS